MAHSNRLLGIPARFWTLISASLVAAAALVPPPGAPPEPSASIFTKPVLMARPETGEPRFVSFGEHEGIGPVWAFSVQTRDSSYTRRGLGLAPGSKVLELGFFQRRDRWTYELTAVRFDKGARSAPSETLWMPKPEAEALRPRVIAELNRRSGEARDGERLASLLDKGLTQESRANWQNGVVLLAWLSIFATIWATFGQRRPDKAEKSTEVMHQDVA